MPSKNPFNIIAASKTGSVVNNFDFILVFYRLDPCYSFQQNHLPIQRINRVSRFLFQKDEKFHFRPKQKFFVR